MQQVDVKLNCYTTTEEDGSTYLYVTIIDNKMFTLTLQFAEITKEFKDFKLINEQYELYDNNNDLLTDLEQGHLQRFMGQPQSNPKLDLMTNLRMKLRHRNRNCGSGCILCNPDIGDDPFPDFTFDINNAEPEDEV